ncbi:MAG: hypothetical protein QXO25_03530 [Candidatus Bathyarchaeia archaeon]
MSYYPYYPMGYGGYLWFTPSLYYSYQQPYSYAYPSFSLPAYPNYLQPVSYYPQYYPFSQPYETAMPQYFPATPIGYSPYRALPMLPSY